MPVAIAMAARVKCHRGPSAADEALRRPLPGMACLTAAVQEHHDRAPRAARAALPSQPHANTVEMRLSEGDLG